MHVSYESLSNIKEMFDSEMFLAKKQKADPG